MPQPPSTIYDVIDTLKVRPAMYLGEASLTALRNYLAGYHAALLDRGIEWSCESPPFGHFHDWIAKQYGWRWPSPSGWCQIITQESTDEQAAMDAFFTLLERFRRRRARQVASIRLGPDHQLTGYRKRNTGGWEPLPPPVEIRIVQYVPDDDVYSSLTYDVCIKGTDDPIRVWDVHYANLTDAIADHEKEFNILPQEWIRPDATSVASAAQQ